MSRLWANGIAVSAAAQSALVDVTTWNLELETGGTYGLCGDDHHISQPSPVENQPSTPAARMSMASTEARSYEWDG